MENIGAKPKVTAIEGHWGDQRGERRCHAKDEAARLLEHPCAAAN